MNLKDIAYERPDLDAAQAALQSLVGRVREAKSAEERLAILSECEALLSHITTGLALTQLRYYTNALEPNCAADMAYLGENAPRLDALANELTSALLDAPDRNKLAQVLGAFFFEQAAAHRRTTTDKNESLQIEEQVLVQEYTVLVAQASVHFEGKTHSLSGMTRFYANPARETRRSAMLAVSGWYEENAAELDGIFDKLVKNRAQQAKNLGFDGYTDLRYATRYGYGRREIEAFRAHIQKTWVPLVSEIKERQRKRLGVETFRMYDSPARFPDGNPKLVVKRRAFVDAARAMFRKLSPEAGDYFQTLDESGMLDLFDRKGKVSYAGFCLWLPDYKMDFICGRFTGDQTDFEVLTHEFGHAYASLRAEKAGVRFVQLDAPQEIMETHSKSMELFTMPCADMFFGGDARRYQIKQLEYIPYLVTSICLGDDFQHAIYDNPEMTPAARNDAYARIYRSYNPYLDETDLPFVSWGSQWQDTLVIYSMPFYYIDYALAQIIALALYRESLSDFSAAWARYLKFMDAAGTMPLPTLAKACGLPDPFDENTLDDLAAFLTDELAKLEG
jgi:M3 family oligoendopeptidase